LLGREQTGYKGADIPYEFLALEVALSSGCRALDLEANEVDSRIGPLLENLAQKVNKKDLEDTRNLKSKLNRLFARTGKVKQVWPCNRSCANCRTALSREVRGGRRFQNLVFRLQPQSFVTGRRHKQRLEYFERNDETIV
jgi:hypothetical protein